jgi:hypothetical protein
MKLKLVCDLCKSQGLKLSYESPSTKRDLKVYICQKCGFIQSWPRLSGVYKRKTSVSGEADWGYIRYGKQLRLDASLTIMRKHINFNNIKSILDIGSNRSYLINHLAKKYNHINFLGIEPDKMVIDKSSTSNRVEFLNIKIEEFESNGRKFDMIHSSHTFEHMVSAEAGFKIAFDLLNDDGFFYLELPRTEMIDNKDFITEYFIDNHLFHFTRDDIKNYLKPYDYKIIYEEKSDWENHVFILKKNSSKVMKSNFPYNNNFALNDKLVSNYQKNRDLNLKSLMFSGKKINELSSGENKIAIWGMGRIFDIFYRYGDVNWNKINYCVDKYLPKYTKEVNGIKISTPVEALSNVELDTLIIFSDAYTNDIIKESKEILKKVKRIINYTDLMKS